MSKEKIDFNFVEESFSGDEVVEHYTNAVVDIGLWNSEKILFEKYIKKTDKILDIGCGAGRTTFGMYKLGFDNIVGIDLSEKMVKKAKEIAEKNNLKIDFKKGNAIHLDFDTETFHAAIFSFNGFMQIPGRFNRLKTLNEIWRILEKDGYFIFTTHDDREKEDIYKPLWREEKRKWENSQQDNRIIDFGDMIIADNNREIYLHFPNRDEVIDLIEDTRFKIIEDKIRSEISDENDETKQFSNDCRFWVLKK